MARATIVLGLFDSGDCFSQILWSSPFGGPQEAMSCSGQGGAFQPPDRRERLVDTLFKGEAWFADGTQGSWEEEAPFRTGHSAFFFFFENF